MSLSSYPLRRFILTVALATVVALGAQATPAAQAAPIMVGVNTEGSPDKGPYLDQFASAAGRRPDIVMWFQDWSEPLFYTNQMPAVDSRGATPMITWTPTQASLRSIADGQHDSYLRASARSAADWGKPFYIRFAHEMNGDWYSWGRAGGNTEADYISAWRHVVELFRSEGADNVRWVWSPNVDYLNMFPISGLYPGDAWVDWVGLDGYNWGTLKGSGWRDLGSVFGESYDQVAAMTDKPVMIAETSSGEAGGDKAAWIRDGLLNAVPRRLPRVRAVVWFDRDKETDWRIDSSPSSLAAFRDVMTSPLYGGASGAPGGSGGGGGGGPGAAAGPGSPLSLGADSPVKGAPRSNQPTHALGGPSLREILVAAVRSSAASLRRLGVRQVVRNGSFTCRIQAPVAGTVRCRGVLIHRGKRMSLGAGSTFSASARATTVKASIARRQQSSLINSRGIRLQLHLSVTPKGGQKVRASSTVKLARPHP